MAGETREGAGVAGGRTTGFPNSPLKELPNLGQVLSGLLKKFHLEHLDTGDILLGLIILFLILEDGDNLDLVITLGLLILFSLGES